jgi:hypothetical protein
MAYSTEWMIDVTSMYRIVSELDHGGAIEGVWDVKDHNLAYIADCAEEGATRELIERFIAESKAGTITLYRHSSESKIPLTNAVHCIRLEPFYFVKDLKKPYR